MKVGVSIGAGANFLLRKLMNMNRNIYFVIAASVAIVAIPACTQSNSEGQDVDVNASTTAEQATEQWKYHDQVDKMRGESTRYASIRADDGYLPMAPQLFVWRNRAKQPQIAIRGSLDEAASPQMQCFSGSVGMKFDDGPIEKVSCTMGMEVGIDPRIFRQLLTSKITWIEIETNLGNSQQYKFKTANLKI